MQRLRDALYTNGWLRHIVLMLLGASLTFAYSPFTLSFLPLVVLPCVVLIINPLNPKQAFRAGFFFGLGWLGAGLSWILVSIDTYGGMPLIADIAVLALLIIYLSLFPALAFYGWRKLSHKTPYAYFSLVLFWFVCEWLRGWLFTGFPWLQLGYTQTDAWLGGLASSIGQQGITAVLWFIALSIGAALKGSLQNRIYTALLLLIFLTASYLLPQLQPLHRTGDTTSVMLVQGNISQSLKWQADQQWPNMLRYLDLTRPNYQHDIIVWPESAITALEPYADDVLSTIDQSAAMNGAALISGIIDYQITRDEFYNTMIVLGDESGMDGFDTPYQYGSSNRYQKHHLLPIGEFVPFEDLLRPVAPLFNLPMSSFQRGEYTQPNLLANGHRLAAAICYEIVFSDQVRANVNNNTDYLITVSNDTWFGDSHGPWQHMQIARMRAMELGRPLIRSTNNGVSGMADEFGRIIAIAPQFKATTVSAELPVVRGTTWFQRLGNWPACLLAGLSLLPLIRLFNRADRGQSQEKSVQ
ncbi:apolipoprotein N-acyltransferase [Idiomarina sp. MD25a]|uniref:apolipoprotein N-acyltransferase n=1 Tax=Idiomarina sp. MD25a TaxID=1889913 RepID=UPI0008F886AD|nr:apolipoprotein N-acyltransferase [Idiomarina sp. MD25a]OIM99830.1 apolipoprotein N-acyltransferase [Idiomarina sp. MD25a]